MTRTRQHIHWFGGKYLLALILVKLFPKSFGLYCEPFAGSLALLMVKEPGVEVVNDLNGDIANLYNVLRDDLLGDRLADLVDFTPYSYDEFCAALDALDHKRPAGEPDLERARLFVVACNQAFMGKAQTKGDWSVEKKSQRNGSARTVSAWNGLPETLRRVGLRIKNAQIENKDWREIIKKGHRGKKHNEGKYDLPDTFWYLDPPYPHCTRKQKKGYAVEMTDDEHRELLKAIKGLKGLVMISGKSCELYDTELSEWRKRIFPCRQKGNPEIVWMNYRRGRKFV